MAKQQVFVPDVEFVVINGFHGHIALCRFDVQAFRPQLFAEYAIELPYGLQAASKKRQAEFLAGRIAAQHALRRFGCPEVQVGRADDGQPLWPAAVTGSISHHTAVACCVVAATQDYCLLGVDVEQYMPADVAHATQALILQTGELEWLAHAALPLQGLVSLIFSAKESLYKALYPQVRRYFDFLDASIKALDFATAKFVIGLDTQLNQQFEAGSTYTGIFLLRQQEVLTLVYQPQQDNHISR